MPEPHVLAFSRQIAQGLAAVHACQIVHRDLKPDNIFLVPDPEVALGERAKVLDFGIAKHGALEMPEPTATGVLVGTPAYMSPEQCCGDVELDGRADIYSLGIVMYRMVTNQLPFEGHDSNAIIGKHLFEPVKPPRLLNPHLSQQTNDLILRCVEKNRDRRFADMKELAQALAAIPGAPQSGMQTVAAPLTTTSVTAAVPATEVIPVAETEVALKPPEPIRARRSRTARMAAFAAVPVAGVLLVGLSGRPSAKEHVPSAEAAVLESAIDIAKRAQPVAPPPRPLPVAAMTTAETVEDLVKPADAPPPRRSPRRARRQPELIVKKPPAASESSNESDSKFKKPTPRF
jgi:serine/threonine-protein kinase